jgi:hypothetical protein
MKNKGLSLVKLFILALAVATALPVLSYAETVRGKFTLESETHWSSAVLPAGDYEFTLDPGTTPAIVAIRKKSGEAVVMLVSSTVSEPSNSSASSLNLETRSDGVFVKSMTLGGVGMEMHFLLPKEKVAIAQTAKQQPAAVPGFAQ